MVINITTSMGVFDNLIFRLAAIFLYYKVKSKNRINEIPVIINNFNRLDSLKKQLAWLEKIEQRNIFIIDNCSDYQPLLDFYKTTPYTVFKLDENVGFLSIWKTIIFKLFKKTYYIYTDSDILPVETCPLNAIVYFYNLLRHYELTILVCIMGLRSKSCIESCIENSYKTVKNMQLKNIKNNATMNA
jgi:hypothetical protein